LVGGAIYAPRIEVGKTKEKRQKNGGKERKEVTLSLGNKRAREGGKSRGGVSTGAMRWGREDCGEEMGEAQRYFLIGDKCGVNDGQKSLWYRGGKGRTGKETLVFPNALPVHPIAGERFRRMDW